jgi:hypothetical protein
MGDKVEGEQGIPLILLAAMGCSGFGYRCCLGIFRLLQWTSMVSHARRGISQDSDIRCRVEQLKLGFCRNLASYLWGKE